MATSKSRKLAIPKCWTCIPEMGITFGLYGSKNQSCSVLPMTQPYVAASK